MMNKKLMGILLLSSLSLVSVVKPNQAQTFQNKYSCIERNGTPTTIVETKRGTIELIVWKSNFFKGSGWDPQTRCEEVSYRFQKFNNAKELKYITTSKINRYGVICVANPKNPQNNVCKSDGVLITVQPGEDPQKVRNELFDVSARMQGGGITRGCPNDEASVWNFQKLITDEDCLPTINLNTNNSNTNNQNNSPQPDINIPDNTPTPDNNNDDNGVFEVPDLFN